MALSSIVYFAAIALPLLITLVAIGLRLAAAVATKIDEVTAPPAPLAEVAELPTVAREIPVVPAVAAPEPGPLQLVDEDEPSTKRCPDCAETVLGSARVCRHCHFRFEPPLRGSWAV